MDTTCWTTLWSLRSMPPLNDCSTNTQSVWARQVRVKGQSGEAWIIELRTWSAYISIYWDYLAGQLILLAALITLSPSDRRRQERHSSRYRTQLPRPLFLKGVSQRVPWCGVSRAGGP